MNKDEISEEWKNKEITIKLTVEEGLLLMELMESLFGPEIYKIFEKILFEKIFKENKQWDMS